MDIFFMNAGHSKLADKDSNLLLSLKKELIAVNLVREVTSPELADVILIQEAGSFKNFRYIKELFGDPILSRYANKVYTINTDDCATGLLRGLYTSIPKHRFDSRIHASVPYVEYPNEQVFTRKLAATPKYLASWRGNPKSNKVRLRMIESLSDSPLFSLQTTTSWLNHDQAEKQLYVNLILNAKFSLCPAGWAPVSYRIYESMALARCPVILADDFVPPLGPRWNEFSLMYPESRTANLALYLRAREHLSSRYGQAAKQAWDSYFSPSVIMSYLSRTLLKLIEQAPKTSAQQEWKRWNSLNVFWNNNWTFPQRIMNKAMKLAVLH